jgi:hypothetical protein
VLQRVTPVVAQVGTQTKQQTLAQSKVENAAPPWWAAQVRAVQMQLQVQQIPALVAVAEVSPEAEVKVTTPVVLEVPDLLWFDTHCLQCQRLT